LLEISYNTAVRFNLDWYSNSSRSRDKKKKKKSIFQVKATRLFKLDLCTNLYHHREPFLRSPSG
jgi:hypothetical protein